MEKIFIDRLKNGEVHQIEESLPPSYIEGSPFDTIEVKGKAYLAEDTLIFHWEIKSATYLPCKICNEPARVPVASSDPYQAIPLEKIEGAIFDPLPLIKENILLQVPLVGECNEGSCPLRKELSPYFAEEKKGETPFSNLDQEISQKK